MSSTGIRVEGEDAVARALGQVGDTADDPHDALQLVALEATRAAAAASPVRTGRLRGSWRPETTKGRALTRSTLVYAGPIDRGWPARNITAAGITTKTDAGLDDFAETAVTHDIDTATRQAGLTT